MKLVFMGNVPMDMTPGEEYVLVTAADEDLDGLIKGAIIVAAVAFTKR